MVARRHRNKLGNQGEDGESTAGGARETKLLDGVGLQWDDARLVDGIRGWEFEVVETRSSSFILGEEAKNVVRHGLKVEVRGNSDAKIIGRGKSDNFEIIGVGNDKADGNADGVAFVDKNPTEMIIVDEGMEKGRGDRIAKVRTDLVLLTGNFGPRRDQVSNPRW
jgi:hypothetical protein